MCGRFTLRTPASVLVERFRLASAPQLPLRFNIAPTQEIAVVRQMPEDAQRRLAMVRWGLIPSWAKDPSIGNRMINARAETVAEKPAFRVALRQRRCLVLADGYYEWQKRAGKNKQPYLIHRRDDRPFAFAGLWEQWRGAGAEEADPLETCTIITTNANDLTREIHDRMPVILDAADCELWLDCQVHDRNQLEPLLRPYDSVELVADPVSTHVNNVRNDDPKCVDIDRTRLGLSCKSPQTPSTSRG